MKPESCAKIWRTVRRVFLHRIRLSESAGESGLDQASTPLPPGQNESARFSESLRTVEQVAGDLEYWVRWIRPGDR
jgi:hypothetical protein